MTVRFKSEYSRSYVPRCRSASPQRGLPLAGLRSAQMRICREPQLQRRRKLGPARSCSSLFFSPPAAPEKVYRKEASREHKPSRLQADKHVSPQEAGGSVEPGGPPRPQSAADPPENPGSDVNEVNTSAEEGSAKLRPFQTDNQSEPFRPASPASDGQQQQSDQVDPVLWKKAGLKGRRSAAQRSEYNRQFRWKTPVLTTSPILTAEQVLNRRAQRPRRSFPKPLQTEYQRSFTALAPPTGPRLRRHFEKQSTSNRKEKDALYGQEVDTTLQATPPLIMNRNTEGGVASLGTAQQVRNTQLKELRQKAGQYRRRAWGTNFSREHLSQLLSEHNTLWEPTDSTASPGDTPNSLRSNKLDPDSGSGPAPPWTGSGPAPPWTGSGRRRRSAPTAPTGPTQRRTASDDQDSTDGEEGRLPTPQLRTRPVQRTHLDLTTPSTGGVILVGKQRDAVHCSPNDQGIKPLTVRTSPSLSSTSSVSKATEAGLASSPPFKTKEAWSEVANPSVSSPSPAPKLKAAAKPTGLKETLPPSSVAPPPQRIQGTMRHPEFQHNGDLGLRLGEFLCSGKSCDSDEDDRLSVMSWRSAASCSAASDVLQRALKRRDDFWGKA